MSAPPDFSSDNCALIPGELTGYRAFYVNHFGELTSVIIREFTWNSGWQTATCPLATVERVELEDSSCICHPIRTGTALTGIAPSGAGATMGYFCTCNSPDYFIPLSSFQAELASLSSHSEKKILHYWGKKRHPDSLVPSQDCECGFYSAYSPMDLQGAPGIPPRLHTHPGSPYIIGAVKASGRILLGSKGFRAERMKIAGLAANGGSPPQGVPMNTTIFRTLGELLNEFPPEDVTELLK